MDDRSKGGLGVIFVILLVLYFMGTFDKALAPMGLNFNECGTNGFGATFCGDELAEYENEVSKPLEEAGQEWEAQEEEWLREEEAAEYGYGVGY